MERGGARQDLAGRSSIARARGGMRRGFGFAATLLVSSALVLTAACSIDGGRSLPPSAPVRPSAAPNVVVILVDDLGWPDVSAYGRREVMTPNIDRIANDGVAFSSGYVTASVCAVSRAGLLSGRLPAKMGFTYNITDRGNATPGAGLPVGQQTIGDRLRGLGYHTGAFGKWHQGSERQFYPTNRGFDEFFGFLAGETVYVDPKTPGIVTTPTKADRGDISRREGNGQIVEGPDAKPVTNFNRYLTTEITDRAVGFIRREAKQRQPFFAYVAYNAPHWPLQVPQSYYDRASAIKDPVRRTYVAMIAAMDDGVGRILDTLQAAGVRDNTIVVFLSDNGCPIQFGFCPTSHPWGAGKFTYLEGGTRVPFLMSWPAGLKSRGIVDTPVSSVDIMPTVLKAAAPRQALPVDLDGYDLVETATRPAAGERTLLWGQAPVFAARRGRFKLWQSEDWRQTYLYDLEADPAEIRDVGADYPAVRDALETSLRQWCIGLPKPLWPLTATRRVKINNRETEWVY